MKNKKGICEECRSQTRNGLWRGRGEGKDSSL